ncbi:Capsule polysaccharide biosynthesis protein [Vibrio chagasii]|nr:Capsule polysaccharide biosynthesis protein [Vibrio chagasii]CAH6956722.1 Capsule polysaccharide biosynthesis protein [Vibrio chagasii]CAH6957051.1 Capsule polysaccharide biosynthesis protein [Vibrio chagasii]CAH7114880.1 Capsule polysaccharide biosynthesis protein [Vibrio chagasii]CAH7352496.1 Capsule polysaccharide biosynthesis protein [Vibrio chagasii]
MKYHILLDNIERSQVFFRMSLSVENDDFVFYTLKPSIYFYFKYYLKVNDIFLVEGESEGEGEGEKVECENDIHVLIGRTSNKLAESIYKRVNIYLSKKSKYTRDDIAIVFNGCQTAARAFYDFFSDKNVKTLSCEISNLPGKMIFDSKGVNAQSFLFENVNLLSEFKSELSEQQHIDWIHLYEDYKSRPIPQSKIKYKHAIFSLVDAFFYCFDRGVKEEDGGILTKVALFLNKVRGSKVNISLGMEQDLERKYVFFPTQVSTDTQILINSDVDNFDAIEMICNEVGDFDVYVKIHPAEQNENVILKYLSLEKDGKITLCKNNTTELIKNAERVYTINSTVGLESLIYNKPLVVYGRAIYSGMSNEQDVKNFLHGYLVDIDYYGSGYVEQSVFDKLYKIASQ